MADRDIDRSVVQWCEQAFADLPWCIAGGAVRDLLLGVPPKDYDVFVMAPADVVKARSMKGTRDIADSEPSSPNMVRACSVDGRPVQVMAMPLCRSVEDVVDGFDWQLCRFARSSTGVLFTPGILPRAGDDLRLHRLTYPLSTMLRGVRFAARFQMEFTAEAAHCIALEMVLDEVEARAKKQPEVAHG